MKILGNKRDRQSTRYLMRSLRASATNSAKFRVVAERYSQDLTRGGVVIFF